MMWNEIQIINFSVGTIRGLKHMEHSGSSIIAEEGCGLLIPQYITPESTRIIIDGVECNLADSGNPSK